MDGPSIRDLQFNDQNTLHLYCAIPFALSIRVVSKHLAGYSSGVSRLIGNSTNDRMRVEKRKEIKKML